MRRVLIWAPLAVFALVFALVAGGLFAPGDRVVKSAMVGKPMPALDLPPLLPDRPGVSTVRATGKPRLVNIFASWCVPCIAEAPYLMQLRRAGVEIEAIAVRDTPEAVRAFLARNGDPYVAIADDRQSQAQFALGSSGVPETFVIDARGRIVEQHIGDIRAEDVAELMTALERAR